MHVYEITMCRGQTYKVYKQFLEGAILRVVRFEEQNLRDEVEGEEGERECMLGTLQSSRGEAIVQHRKGGEVCVDKDLVGREEGWEGSVYPGE